MSKQEHAFKKQLKKRLKLASQAENMGDKLIARDYLGLMCVTVVVPAILMLVGWNL